MIAKAAVVGTAALLAGVATLTLVQNGERGGAAGPRGAIVLTGTIEAREVDVGSEVGGRIVSFVAEEGVAVRRGDVLATIDDREVRLRTARLEARLAAAEAEVADLEALPRREDLELERSKLREAEVVLATALVNLERARELRAKNISAQEELDARAADHRLAGQRLETARRALAAVEAGARPAQVAAAKARRDELGREVELA